MGREIRMVPANWEHPMRKPENDEYRHGGYQPMFNEKATDAYAEWLERFDKIRAEGIPEDEKQYYPRGVIDWLQDEGNPPHPDYYLPDDMGECTWFQLYETVSEGTPVSPPFESKEELIDYLAQNGDFWDQKRCKQANWQELWGGVPGVSAWGKERAERFVNVGWAPSMIVSDGQGR